MYWQLESMKRIILILTCIVILVFGFLIIKHIKKTKILESEKLELSLQNKRQAAAIERLTAQRDQNWDLVDSLDKISYVLELDLKEKESIIKELRDSLKRIPAVIEELPKGASYEYLQARYESFKEEKEYPFSDAQVRSIHNDVVTKDLLENINSKLVSSNAILKEKVLTKEKIEEGLLSIIDTYKEENTILGETNSLLKKNNIRLKVQRNISTMIVVIEALGIIGLIAL